MGIKDLKKHFHEIELGGEKIKLALTMDGGEKLAEKYKSVFNAFDALDTLSGDGFRLTKDQINLIADFILAMSDRFTDPSEIKKLLNMKNIGEVVRGIKAAVIDNIPQPDPDRPPVKP